MKFTSYKRAILGLFLSFFIFPSISYAKLRPFKSHACEMMLSRFFGHLKKNQMSEAGLKDSSAYLDRFKNNFLVVDLNRSKKIDHAKIKNSFFRPLNVTSESSYSDRLSVLKQMNGIKKSESSIFETKRLTLYGDEIEDFLNRYHLLIEDLPAIPRIKIPYVEKGILLSGLFLIGNMIFHNLNHVDLMTNIHLMLNLIAYHQGAQTFSLVNQFFFGRDFKITSFLKALANDFFHRKTGFWHYRSFTYQMSQDVYRLIKTGIIVDEPSIDDEFYDRSTVLFRFHSLGRRRKKIWVSFDFLYYFDPQLEQPTLSIVLRSSDEKPKTKEKKPAKVKKNQKNQKVKIKNGLGAAS